MMAMGDDEAFESTPKLVSALARERVVDVSALGYHTTAVTADGRVFSWGHGSHGQLGLGDTENQHTPNQITALAGHRIVHVDAGAAHTIMATASQKWA